MARWPVTALVAAPPAPEIPKTAAGCLGHVAGRAWLRSFAAGLRVVEVECLPADVADVEQVVSEPKH